MRAGRAHGPPGRSSPSPASSARRAAATDRASTCTSSRTPGYCASLRERPAARTGRPDPATARALRDEPQGSRHRLEPRVLAVAAPDLRRRLPVGDHDVAGEVVGAADERRADAIGVDRHALVLELADLRLGEATAGDDAHAVV